MNLLWSLVILATNNKSQPSKSSSVNHVIEVCVSPGCIADGAQGALSKLKALAPPSVCVKSGKCVSLCGKGPVLIQNPDNDKTKVLHRYMNDPKLVPFVKELAAQDLAEDKNEDGDEDSNGGLTAAAAAEILDDLVEGYDLITEGEHKLSKKSYAQASDDLREGINKAFQPSQIYGGDMEWMAQAHRSLAESFLAQGPQKCQDAKEAVQVSLDLAPEDLHHLSYELLGRICEAGNDGEGEYRALKAYFDLPEPLDPPREVVNRRRTLGFRFQKLKMEFGGES